MAERIYTRGEHGGLEPLNEEPFSSEDELQELIARNPELLDGEQMRPGDPRRWILITREKAIAETSDSGARWAVDHLIIDQDAVPTLAEVKLSSNPEIRRTVVGQLLEYAAHAAQTWTVDEIRQTFEESAGAQGRDPGDELGKLLQADGEPDADGFWQKVATNLAARRLRLLFVADQIPDPLARVVELLNSKMPDIEVLAVEIKQFRGKSTQTLVPRVIGRTARHPPPRTKMTRESFLAALGSEAARAAAARLLDVAQESGGSFGWGSSGVSVRVRCSVWPQPVSVAWLFPPSISGWMGFKNITFGQAISSYDPPPEEGLRALLDQWASQFSGDDFAEERSGEGLKAWEVDYDAAALHIDLLADRLTQVLAALKAP